MERRPIFRLASDLVERRDAAEGEERKKLQQALDLALDAIEAALDDRIAALPPRHYAGSRS